VQKAAQHDLGCPEQDGYAYYMDENIGLIGVVCAVERELFINVEELRDHYRCDVGTLRRQCKEMSIMDLLSRL